MASLDQKRGIKDPPKDFVPEPKELIRTLASQIKHNDIILLGNTQHLVTGITQAKGEEVEMEIRAISNGSQQTKYIPCKVYHIITKVE